MLQELLVVLPGLTFSDISGYRHPSSSQLVTERIGFLLWELFDELIHLRHRINRSFPDHQIMVVVLLPHASPPSTINQQPTTIVSRLVLEPGPGGA